MSYRNINRWTCVSLLLLAASCFNPRYQEGIECSEARTCPPGMMCDPGDNLCRLELVPRCNDGQKNGAETDVDCGGPDCPPCADGQSCAAGSDCASQVCTALVCQVGSCGDGVIHGGEMCDGDGMGTGGETALCNADCTLSACGDGIVNSAAGESCDDAGESATCNANCTLSECGDGILNETAGEQCDDGNLIDGDGCESDCTLGSCVSANGLFWCYNPGACGEPCNEMCAALGMTPIADSTVWLEAQNTEEKCQAISMALGLGPDVFLGSYGFACLEDNIGQHEVGGGLLAPLYCSTYVECPDRHLTDMDQNGIPCGPGSRRSICPCE